MLCVGGILGLTNLNLRAWGDDHAHESPFSFLTKKKKKKFTQVRL